jgi:hypothetical protein
MPQILSTEISASMQNVYTPLPMKVHFIFCVIATLIYIIQYARKNSLHYLLVMFAIDLTFVTQICTTSVVMSCLFVAEVILLAAAGVFSHRYNKKLKARKQGGADKDNAVADGDSEE